jgi:hypothetical protein
MAAKATTQKRLAAPPSGVTVRMYSAGFGDCFLLAFRGKDGEPRYVLIDCGVHQQWTGGPQRMDLVANDIAQATGGKLHVVAVTHEHADHIYGFKYAKPVFDTMEIDELWLAWTEDPTNPVAKELKDLCAKRAQSVQAAIARLQVSGSPLANRLAAVLGFEVSSGTALRGTADILDDLRGWTKKKLAKPEDYQKPGDSLEIPNVKGVKCHVLGPPEDVGAIKKLIAKKEMYTPLATLDPETAFVAALAAASDAGAKASELFEFAKPFDGYFEIPEESAASDEEFGGFFKKYYGFGKGARNGPEWRRINADWLAASDQLALSINSMTNNTSLVLAFELTETEPRKVLLFAGDAQMGSWLSWQDVECQADGKNNEKLTGSELLRRTVLYKVGHHGSLNATARAKGLEMMESSELSAMISVDEVWARTVEGWDHPEKVIVERLMEKARGRVIRSDKIPTGKSMDKVDWATDAEWEEFVGRVEWDRSPNRLWIQYTVC